MLFYTDCQLRRIVSILIFIQLLIWEINLLVAGWLPYNNLGFGSTIIYYVLAIAMSATFYICFRKGYTINMYLCIILILLIVFVTPSYLLRAIEITPYSNYLINVAPISEIFYLTQNERWYQAWPGGILFINGMIDILAVEPKYVFLWFPLISKILVLFIVLGITHAIFNDIKYSLLCYIFYIGVNAVDLNNLIPSNIAYIYSLVVILCFIIYLKTSNCCINILILISLLVLIVSHLLYSTLFLLTVVLLYFLLKYAKISNKIIIYVLITTALLIIFWTIYFSQVTLNSIKIDFFDSFLNMGSLMSAVNQAQGMDMSDNGSIGSIKLVRNLGLGIYVLFTILGLSFVYSAVRKGNTNIQQHKLLCMIFILLLAIVPFALFPIINYNNEFLTRTLLICSFPIALFCTVAYVNLESKTNLRILFYVLIISAIIAPIFSMNTHYGYREMSVTPVEDETLFFEFIDKLDSNIVIYSADMGFLDVKNRLNEQLFSEPLMIDILNSKRAYPPCYIIEFKFPYVVEKYNGVQLGRVQQSIDCVRTISLHSSGIKNLNKIYVSGVSNKIYIYAE